MNEITAPAGVGSVGLVVDAHLATVLLDRPEKLNALTPEMLADLERVLETIDGDAGIRAVIVASAGERAFCVGADIKRFKVLSGTAMWSHWTRRGHQVFDRLAHLRQPTVAALDGHAFGGGLELALACDLRVVASDATLGLTEVGLGTVPGWGGTQRLPAQIGVTRAKQMILTATPIDAATAHAWGLVNEVVPRGQVASSAHKLAESLAARAPMSVQMAKQAIDVAQGAPPGPALEGIASAATAGASDFTEGLNAFTERRSARFGGLTDSTDHPEERQRP
jgi:enoyl-CoA hydratase/carnithine racemase